MANQIRCGSSLIWLFFLFLLGSSTYIIFKLFSVTQEINHTLAAHQRQTLSKTFSEIELSAQLLRPLNSTALSLATTLSSSLNGTQIQYEIIKTKIAPTLFLALSTIPQVSKVSFLGTDGLFFSYYFDKDQTRAMYCDVPLSSTWYVQPVNRDTGELYGQPLITEAKVLANDSWIEEALKKTNVYSYLGTGVDKAQTLLYENIVRMDGRGLISVSFPATVLRDQFSALEFHVEDFHLASDDGRVLVHTRLPNTHIVTSNGTVAIKSIYPNGWYSGPHSCRPEDSDSRNFSVIIKGIKHTIYCSTLQVAGLNSVYTVAFADEDWNHIKYANRLSLTLVILLFVVVVIALSIYVILILRAAKREMILWVARVKQLECTQQAECKSMNKSMAFAKATHDIRNSLTAIADLLDLCHKDKDVGPTSELAGKITQIKTCTMDLIDLLGTVLDTKKIEAGKVQLENKEFDLQQLLEDVVDMYYPIGKRKDVDVILDPCDGSILKSHLVKGDRGKLKQVLCNLLGNAVKFTPRGHVTVRGIARKPTKLSSNTSRLLKCLKINDGFNDLDDLCSVEGNSSCMEFEFDVDDTGVGIEKSRRKDVFLYYVQVKDSGLGQEGCGLGLGIVQSLVRLMGGEIKIVDKEPLEGTCFRFNIKLMVSDSVSSTTYGQETNVQNDAQSHESHPHFGLHIPFPASRSDGSHVILYISGEERGKILKKFIETRGVKVSTVRQMIEFSHVLDRIVTRMHGISSLDETEVSSESLNTPVSRTLSSGTHKDFSGSSDVAGEHPLSNYKSSNSRASSTYYTLIIIDADAITVPLLELYSVIANFRRTIHKSNCCKVVWVDIPITRDSKLTIEPNEDTPISHDIVLSKPLHGSRLYDVLRLLPEFKVTSHNNSPPNRESETTHGVLHSKIPSTTNDVLTTSSSPEAQHLEKVVIIKSDDQSNVEKRLSGKKILVVEDVEILRKVVTAKITNFGATVDTSANGQEAVDQVSQMLTKQRTEAGSSKPLPYDYILMDCEMPIMDGYEATRRIRIEEKTYGVYIPIIALTAHAWTDEAIRKTKDVGMDFHLTKPLQVDRLLDCIRDIETSNQTVS